MMNCKAVTAPCVRNNQSLLYSQNK